MKGERRAPEGCGPSTRRVARMEEVLDQRLSRVRVAIEAVYHRHNVSAILRTCDALGVHTVHVVAPDREGVRASPARGAERWLDLRRHPSAEHAVEALAADGFDVWVADLVGQPRAPEDVPVDRPICLWLGAELVGVSEVARRAARGVVTVPMRGMVQSLNVSVAAALALRPIAERARAVGAGLPAAERAAWLAAWVDRDRSWAESD